MSNNNSSKEKKTPKYTLEEFRGMAEQYSHVPPAVDSYQNFIARENFRQQLFKLAVAGGKPYMDCFIDVTSGDIDARLDKAKADGFNEGYKSAREIYEERIPTGDPDFDEFRNRVIYYDSTYMYSDDVNVWRRGNDNQKRIEELLKRGGIYTAFLEYWKKVLAKKV